MVELIDAAYANLSSGSVWGAFTNVYTSVMGGWFWIAIILIADVAVALKSKNGFLTLMMNALLAAVFQSFIPDQVSKIMFVLTALGVGALFFILFRREPQ